MTLELAGGQIVLTANCNGGMLRLITLRHDDDDGDVHVMCVG